MENLSQEELCVALKNVVDLALCPVCHETLTPKVALCVQGHPICEACKKQLNSQICPLCRDKFSSVRPNGFIRQVLESLPHPCRHKGCDYFVRTMDDHEKYCTFKPTKCRYCSWSGPESGLVSHISTEHSELRKYLVPLMGSLEKGIPFNPKIECSVFTPIFVEGHFFWGEMVNDPDDEKLTAVFHPVGNGKTDIEFKGSVKLNHKQSSYCADVKLNLNADINSYTENCISIPTSILPKFVIDDKLQYVLTVEVTMLQSLVTLLQSGIKSGVSYLKTFQQ